MKVKEIKGTAPAGMTMAELKVGELAIVTDGPYKGDVVLRIQDHHNFHVISLSRLDKYWLTPNTNLVRVLSPGEEVVLVNDK